MTPYAQGKRWTLYAGDCLDVLPALQPVDVVVTDPPYNAINRETGGLRTIDKGEADSAPVDIPTLAPLLYASATGSAYVWCSDEQFSGWTLAFKALGGSTRIGVWWKTNPSPMNGDKLWLSATELCAFFRKPGAPFYRRCRPPVWKGPTEQRDDHPTPKPVWLMREQIAASTMPGGVVLDPFAGSGTTGVAALLEGMRFVGIERDVAYLPIIARRLADAEAGGVQTSMFGPAR